MVIIYIDMVNFNYIHWKTDNFTVTIYIILDPWHYII